MLKQTLVLVLLMVKYKRLNSHSNYWIGIVLWVQCSFPSNWTKFFKGQTLDIISTRLIGHTSRYTVWSWCHRVLLHWHNFLNLSLIGTSETIWILVFSGVQGSSKCPKILWRNSFYFISISPFSDNLGFWWAELKSMMLLVDEDMLHGPISLGVLVLWFLLTLFTWGLWLLPLLAKPVGYDLHCHC